MTPSFNTSIGFLTDAIFDRKLMHFCAANEKLFLSQVVGDGHLQKPVFKGYFFIHKYFLASWMLILSTNRFKHVMVHLDTLMKKRRNCFSVFC